MKRQADTNGRIKVLECIRQGQVGGGETHMLSLVSNLNIDVFEPIVLSFTEGPMVDAMRAKGIPTFVIPTTLPFDFRVWKKVRKLMAEQKVQLVHAHGTRACSNVLSAARKLALPVVYTVHGWSFHPGQTPLHRHLRIKGEKYLTDHTTENIAVSYSCKAVGEKYIPGISMQVVHNGINFGKFNPSKTYKNIRSELGIGAHKTIVLFLARFTNHKQPLTLLKAFLEAMKKNEQLHLLMVGDGDEKATAEQMIASAQANDRITLLPFRSDVPDILAAADIYVLPSLWEGFPIGLLEAMAMGLAIIASDVDGNNEVMMHKENGLLVRTEDMENELEKSILTLAADSELRIKLGEMARFTVLNRFDEVSMTRQIEDIYQSILALQHVPHATA